MDPRPVVLLADSYPVLSETFVVSEATALAALGHDVRVLAGVRPKPEQRGRGEATIPVTYLDGGRRAAKLVALARLCARHPWCVVRDAWGRRRWRKQERTWPLSALASVALSLDRDTHLHAHFASPAALNALRLSRLAGNRFSFIVHGYDLYRHRMNLEEKLRAAAFAAAPCDYSARHLEALEPGAVGRVHRIVMGVDGEVFTRTRSHPAGRHVVAIGRLVEKKGFAHLIEAAAVLERPAPLDRVSIVGDGPLAETLERLVEQLGLSTRVRFMGALSHEAVRDLLGEADLLVMPSVIAADGDRDTMPVVVKEALAMEVRVVASDEVGLPEIVKDPWGKLAPPGDADALALAIERMLGATTAEREAAGLAGRKFVLRHCDVNREAERLSALIEETAAG